MDPRQLAVAAEVFQQVLELPEAERSAWLAERCGSDQQLRAEVESLLAHHARAENFLADTPYLTAPAQPTSADEMPNRIGHYEIEQVLGRGGMGVVYRATQNNPRRAVALKVVRNPFAGEDLLRRFEVEAQTLARLAHPGIARIFEAGAAETAFGVQPFFAMELIDGQPLGAYADVHGLDTPARLELLALVADAISHAHQKGVIHRDLKPANILVDQTGQPRVLDFGVARIADADAQVTSQTNPGQVLGTLAYMSPEQARGDADQLDTRSDVYALGVIAYELLAGKLPIALDSRSLATTIAAIEREEPRRLGLVQPACRGDIETIVHKALEKDAQQRYASAADFAADIRRYLQNQPILARPGSAMYQLSKFARRHKGLVGGATLAVLALAIGLVVSLYAFFQAEYDRRSSEQAVAFLARMMGAASPTELGADVRLVDVLDLAADEVSTAFVDYPHVEAEVRGVLAESYLTLGRYEQAATQFKLQEDLLASTDQAAMLRARVNHATALQGTGAYAQAEQIMVESLAEQQAMHGDLHDDTITTRSNLGVLLAEKGELQRSAKLARETYDLAVTHYGVDTEETLGPLNNLASVLDKLEETDEAARLYALLIKRCEEHLEESDPRYQIALNNYATQLFKLGRDPEAVEVYERLLEVQERVLSENHRSVLLTLNNYALSLRDVDRDAEAREVLADLVQRAGSLEGQTWPNAYSFHRNYSITLMDTGEFSVAVEQLETALVYAERHLPRGHPIVAQLNELLGKAYLEQRDFAGAEPACRAALEILTRFFPDQHPNVQDVLRDLADALRGLGREDEALAIEDRLLPTRPD